MINEDLKPLADQIRKFREKLGLSQEQLANKCGFDRTYISLLETAKRNISFLNLIKLANGLEVDLPTLTGVYNASYTNK